MPMGTRVSYARLRSDVCFSEEPAQVFRNAMAGLSVLISVAPENALL